MRHQQCTPDEEALYRAVGARLKRRRTSKGLTLRELGTLTGLPYRRISDAETARSRTHMFTVCKVAHALGMRTYEVFADDFADVAKPGVTKS